MFTDKRFQHTIAGRKTSDYIMNNVATSNNAAYLNVVKTEEETTEKSERQKKKERRAGCSKSSYSWDLKGKKIDLKMVDSTNKDVSEVEASRRSPNPRVEQTTQTEVETTSAGTQASVRYEEAVSVVSSSDGIDLIRPYLNMPTEVKVEVQGILMKQFEKCVLQVKGWTPLFGVSGEAWYSVSFMQGDKIPDFADVDEVMQLLAGLNLNDTIAWGLRRIQPYIGVSSTELDRWQVTLEFLSQDELEREAQMVRFLMSNTKVNLDQQKEQRSAKLEDLNLSEMMVDTCKYGQIRLGEFRSGGR